MTRTERFAFGGVAALLTILSVAPFAQASGSAPIMTSMIGAQEGPWGPPPPGGGSPRNGGPGGSRGPRRMPPPISAATIPAETMTAYLKLTGTQVGKIRELHAALREEMRPPRGAGGSGQRPQPPSPTERQARTRAIDAAIQEASAAVTDLLNEEQKLRLVTLLQAFDALRAGRIPPPALRDLQLTEAQWTQLGALGKNATHETILALLTDAQKAALESSRPGPDGRGRPPHEGPPPPGGFGPDGPPPPDGFQ
ncbi:MAG: hypothetical protein H7145_22330 [Akkermansiaceae bacterium]|nr:hypothetical protein [Armatimonadota bacterium]